MSARPRGNRGAAARRHESGRRRGAAHDKKYQGDFLKFSIPAPSTSVADLVRSPDEDEANPVDPPNGKTRSSDDWSSKFAEVATIVSEAKSALDSVNNKVICRVLQAVDLYSSLKERIRRDYRGQNVTNAWLKMYEMICRLDLFPQNEKEPILAMFNAELPGAFIVATNHFMRTLRPKVEYDWRAASYYSSGVDTLGDTYGIYACNQEQWLMDPPTAPGPVLAKTPTLRGDVTETKDLEELEKRLKTQKGFAEGVTLYTSDAGIDVSGNWNRQEEDTSLINFGQIVLGLMVLKKEGTMITKQYTFCTPFSATLLALVSGLFREFMIVKPLTSRPANSEVYVVGRGFLGLDDSVREFLLGKVHSYKKGGVYPADGPALADGLLLASPLLALLNAARQIHMRQQVAFLAEAVEFAQKYGNDTEKLRRDLFPLARRLQNEWLTKNTLIPLGAGRGVPSSDSAGHCSRHVQKPPTKAISAKKKAPAPPKATITPGIDADVTDSGTATSSDNLHV